MEGKIARFAPLAGVVFVALVIVSFAVEGDSPDIDDTPESVVEFYADNETEVVTASGLASIGAAALVVFATSVRREMSRRNSESSLLATAALGGGLVAAAGIGTDSAIRFALAESAGDISPEATQALFAFWDGFFWPMALGFGVLILAVSLSGFETRVVPVWLAALGVIVGVALFTPAGFIALMAFALWVLVMSFLLWRYESRSEAGDDTDETRSPRAPAPS